MATSTYTFRVLATIPQNGGYQPYPKASLVFDAAGDLFGTTAEGGSVHDGSVFEVVKGSGVATTLVSFGSAQANSYSNLVLDGAGDLYGTTQGGASLFEVVKTGSTYATTATTLVANQGTTDTGVYEDAAGDLYSATTTGGLNNKGQIFELINNGSVTQPAYASSITTIASFSAAQGYGIVFGSLVADSAGNLYGATAYGPGGNENGIVFEVAQGSGTITTLASLNAGTLAYGGVVLDGSGDIFGTTEGGGGGSGTLYEVVKGSAVATTLVNFSGASGTGPTAAPVLDAAGDLFGTTIAGGTSSDGTVYEVQNTGSVANPAYANGATVLYNFTGGTDGANPYGGLIFDASGNLYGDNYDGTLYELTPPAPTLVSEAANPTSGDLNAGKTVTFSIGTNEAVSAAGSFLTLSNGATAVYTSGNGRGTTPLVYTYTVAAGDTNTTDLKATKLNGTISSFGAKINDSSFTQIDSKDKIDTVVPKLTSFVANGATATDATTVSYTATFSEPVTGVSTDAFVLDSSSTDTAASITSVTAVSGSNGAQYTVTVDTGGAGSDGTIAVDLIGAAIKDGAGNGYSGGNFQSQTTTAAGYYPTDVATGDLNGDGNVDLVVAGLDNGVSVLLGNGDGTFQSAPDEATGTTPYSVAIADLNGDGHPDLAVADNNSGNSGTVSVLLGNGDGTFQPQTTYATGNSPSVAIADLNGDGHPDLVVANAADNDVGVLLGNGDGTFQPQSVFGTSNGPLAVAVADVNGDGKLDLVTGNDDGTVSVLLGNGNGTFQAQTTYGAGGGDEESVALADLNGDGHLDIAVVDGDDNIVSVLLGNGNGTFQAQTSYATGALPDSVAIADVNGDGRPDIVVANLRDDTVSVLLGNGNGTFQPQTMLGTGGDTTSVAIADVNGDGRPDIVTSTSSNDVTVQLNGPQIVSGPTFTVGPTLTSETASPLASSLTVGQTVTFSIGTSEAVTATGSSLTLSNGVTVAYTSGSGAGSTPLVYSYTVAAGDPSTNDLQATTLNGTIVDSAGDAINDGTFTPIDTMDTVAGPPVVVAETATVPAGGTASGTSGASGTGALAGDSDSTGGTLSITSVSAGSGAAQPVATGSTSTSSGTTLAGTYGTLTIGADGSYSYADALTPAQSLAILTAANGSPITDTFSDTVINGNSQSTPSSLAIATSLSAGGAETVNDPTGSATFSLGATTLTLTDDTASTFGGIIQDGSSGNTGGSLIVAGTSPLALTGADTYSGTTTINAGATLQLGYGGTTGSIGSSGTITDNGTLVTDENANVTLKGPITGSGALSVFESGNNTFLNGAASYTGATTIASGAILYLGTGGSLTGTSSIADDGTLATNTAATLTIAAPISGAGGVQQQGPGTTILSGANTYTGTTFLSGGTLKAGVANAFGSGSMVQFYPSQINAILDLGGSNQAVGALASTPSTQSTYTVTDSGPAATLSVGNGNATGLFSGVIQNGNGALSLIKAGTGTQFLSGANTFTGGTTLAAGALDLYGASALGTTGTLSFAGGTLQYSVNNQTDYSSRFSSAAGEAYSIDTNGQAVTLASGLASSGGTLTKVGAGTLKLSGANTYTGGTTLSGGTLELASATASGGTATTPGGVTFSGSPAILQLDAAALASGGAYAGAIAGFALGDTLDLRGLVYASDNLATLSGSTLTVGDATTADTLSAFSNAGGQNPYFVVSSDGSGGTDVALQSRPAAPTKVAVAPNPSSYGVALSITGTGDAAGDTIKVYGADAVAPNSTMLLGTTTVRSDGSLGFSDTTPAGEVPDGTFVITTTDTSAGGTTASATSSSVTVVVHANAPANLAQTNAPVNGGVISVSGTTVDAAGDTVAIYATAMTAGASKTFLGDAAVTAGSGGNPSSFTYTSSKTFTYGSYTITATDTSVDQSQSASASITATVAPATPNVTAETDAVVAGQIVSEPASSGALKGDSDPNGGTLGVTQVSYGGTTDTVAAGSTSTASPTTIAGAYGTLTIGADGSYGYAATNGLAIVTAANGSPITDTFADVVTASEGTSSPSSLAITTSLAAGGAETVTNASGPATYSLGATTLTLNETAASSYGGVIQDGSSGNVGGNVTVAGSAPLTLTGASTYSGMTKISGTLDLSGSGSIANSSKVKLNVAGAVFDISGSTTGVVVNASAGVAGTKVDLGAKTLQVNENQTNGATTFAGVIQDGGSSGGTGGSFIVGGSAPLVLTGANTYTGMTKISGTLDLTGSGSIANSSKVKLNVAGAVFDISGSTTGVLVNAFAGVAGTTVDLGAGTLQVNENQTNGATTFAGVIQDGGSSGGTGGSFIVGGAAPLVLTGTNTYTGMTKISGTLDLTGSGSISGSSKVKLNAAGAVLDISGASGTETINAFAGVAGTTVDLGSKTLAINENQTNGATTFAGVIQDGGSAGGTGGSLTVNGSATLLLTGSNTYTGGTTLAGGSLELDAAGAAGTGTITFAGAATLKIDAPALTGTAGVSHFANTIAGATSANQVIDLTSLQYVQGSTSATAVGTALAVTDGSSTVTLTLASAPGVGKTFVTAADATGGTLVYDPPASAAPATAKGMDTSWIAMAMAPFGVGGVLGDAHAGGAVHDPYATIALATAGEQAHAASVFGHPHAV